MADVGATIPGTGPTSPDDFYDVYKNPAAPVTTPKGPIFETAAGSPTAKAGDTGIENVFHIAYRVFIEGVEVPCHGVNIAYGVEGVPQCTVIIPASKMLRDLPNTTKLAVFFRDLVPESDGTYHWRLLFDGEFAGYNYGVSPTGASMGLSFMHNAAHMHSMQLMVMDMTEYWVNGGIEYAAGDGTIVAQTGFNRPEKTILKDMLDSSKASSYKSMADIAYTLVRAVLADTRSTPTGKYFKKKFGDSAENGVGGYKLLRRFYGISESAKSAALPGLSDIGGNNVDSGGYSGGSYGGPTWQGGSNPHNPTPDDKGVVGQNPDKIGPDRSADADAKAKSLANKDFSYKTGRNGNNCSSFVSEASGLPDIADVSNLATYTSQNGTLFTSMEELKPGDLVFIKDSSPGWPAGTTTHVGVYAGNGQWTHCRGPVPVTESIGTNYGGDASNNYNGYVFYYGRLKK